MNVNLKIEYYYSYYTLLQLIKSRVVYFGQWKIVRAVGLRSLKLTKKGTYLFIPSPRPDP